MNKRMLMIALLVVAGILPISANAAEFNGSKPFICTIIEAYECEPNADCKRVTVQDIDCPRFLRVDVSKKIIVGTMTDQSTRDVEIQSSAHVEGNFILQGVQKDRAWSMVVSESTGMMTLTVTGQDAGFVFFGASYLP